MLFDEKEGISLIGSARHILLNDLQLIKGYLFLQQVEKADALMDRMTERLRSQSRISHLGIPKSAFFLITFPWSVSNIQVEMEVVGSEKDLGSFDESLESFLRRYFMLTEQLAVDGHVRVIFELSTTGDVLKMIFTGKMNNTVNMHWAEPACPFPRLCSKRERTGENVRWKLCLSIK
ncbi:MAG: sporulation initiation phosphotransferase B [Sporolactobacillus sp.]|jgi:hypothetical protein|nr:sporulation initiation phosphotransferase B [Sporolactobacillus sp.]